MKKRPYNLDYNIPDSPGRAEFVRNLVDTIEVPLSASDLEQLADYILYGRDANGQNAVQRGETLDSNRRHRETYARSSEKTTSLDALLEDTTYNLDHHVVPTAHWGTYTHPTPSIVRPHRTPDGKIDEGDGTLEGMKELWETIANLERVVAANTGKLPMTIDTPAIRGGYEMYKVKHVLIDLQRQQYVLKRALRPAIKFNKLTTTYVSPPINFDEDSFYWLTENEWRRKLAASYNPRLSRRLEDYETRVTPEGVQVKWVVRKQKFEWENPKHVRALMEHYDMLEAQDGHKPETWGYTLLQDFKHYRQAAALSPLRDYMVELRTRNYNYIAIAAAVEAKFGVRYNSSYLCHMLTTVLPQAIARAATIERLWREVPKEEYKVCELCGRAMPAHPIFFGSSSSTANQCRECVHRCYGNKLKEGRKKHDKRQKDQTMYTVQARKKSDAVSKQPQSIFAAAQELYLYYLLGADVPPGGPRQCGRSDAVGRLAV